MRTASANFEAMRGQSFIALVETAEGWSLIQHSEGGSVYPRTSYETKRQIAARVLQLLGIGPVAPQTWPESVCIGEISYGKEV